MNIEKGIEGIERFKYGQFSLTPEEKKKAEKKGVLGAKQSEVEAANKRLKMEQSEKAIKELEEHLKVIDKTGKQERKAA
ncbi:hypothetical protein COS61_02665 [Candidatus Wolfebacteria bacterium CG03_land_8_20_14_0_80_40_12]|uniref:Uncharacterized protein n=1 Tax=Candidatus Wolfebacteria bacterium CG03_land_8_20_14_0_80_40_12 TaxID=1975069 RepID=A0A2M7B509_9BACT|nr:MAG: hypothetical protein COS61_02665 [Candidatus Wolfebacteria bacterium CG03_land_8_20_14_0_80_40_12]